MHVRRQFTQTTPRVSRYGSGTNGGGFGNGLRRMADKNMQTKKAYVQAEQQLRPSRHLWRAFGFFVGVRFLPVPIARQSKPFKQISFIHISYF